MLRVETAPAPNVCSCFCEGGFTRMTKRRIFSLTILKNDVRKISGVFLKTMSLTLTSVDHFMTPNDCLHKHLVCQMSFLKSLNSTAKIPFITMILGRRLKFKRPTCLYYTNLLWCRDDQGAVVLMVRGQKVENFRTCAHSRKKTLWCFTSVSVSMFIILEADTSPSSDTSSVTAAQCQWIQ